MVADRIRIATASLCGCFGCHMSFLDIDERLIDLVDIVEFDRSPINDIKKLHHCNIGLIEGGVANEENVEVLRTFRQQCDTLVALGACAVNGGIPAMRNLFTLQECLETWESGHPNLPAVLNALQLPQKRAHRRLLPYLPSSDPYPGPA